MTTTGSIKLTPQIVKKYLVNGQAEVTDQEVAMFIGMCKANRLNPFNKDAYLIKYGNQPASIITSKDVFFKRAIENPNFDGMESGIIVINSKGEMIKREGQIYTSKEEIIGAWARVYRKDWEHPIYQEVNMVEYAGRTKTGELNSNWKVKPAVMISKVAEATALRKAFTDNLQRMYLLEESDNIEEKRQAPVDLL
jgi:phage recombination protein Bet